MKRRDLLRVGLLGGLGGAGVFPPVALDKERWQLIREVCSTGVAQAQPVADQALPSEEPLGSPALARYVDPLPIPPVIGAGANSGSILEVRMQPFLHKAHRDLPATTMWGYNGMWPGPTIDVERDSALLINWINALPPRHFLPIDRTIHGAEEPHAPVRTIVHVHGAQVLPDSDGFPDAWISPDGSKGPYYVEGPSVYRNRQPATMLWYHDHAIGVTRQNIYAGLAGMYLIRDEEERALNLPSGRFEIPLLIQDRMFTASGALHYPRARNGTHPAWIQEFMGDVICVNGKVTPVLKVEPRKYRFRLVNACNSRFLQLRLLATDSGGAPLEKGGDAPVLNQIGSDAGLMPAPVKLRYLITAPGERFDLVIDFSGQEGRHFAFNNDAAAPYPRGGEAVPSDVMLFSVGTTLSEKDTSQLPQRLASYGAFNPYQAVRERILGLTESERASDGYTEIGLLGERHWSDPISEDVKAGSMEVWSFANATEDAHPIHIHLVRFQVINRQPFDVNIFKKSGKLVPMGRALPPEGNESPAWKDTVKTYPGFVTRVVARFDLPEGTPARPGEEFLYVWHCHMFEHEDNEMMRPFRVIA